MKGREIDEINHKIKSIQQEPEMEDNSGARQELEQSIEEIDKEIGKTRASFLR